MFVYVWKHNKIPFYVGLTKSAGRCNPFNSGGRGWLCKQTLEKIERKNVVVELHAVDTLEEAQILERSLIEKYGRIQLGTGTLTNLRPGGDGSSGMSEAGRLATSKRMKENNPVLKAEVRAKITARMHDPDVKAKFLGNNNPAKRPEVRAKIKAKWADPEFKEKQRQKKLGKPIHTEESKEKLRQRLLDPKHPMKGFHLILNSDPVIKEKRLAGIRSPEARAKMSAKQKERWAKRKNTMSTLP